MGRKSSSFKLNRSGAKAKAAKKQLSVPGATSTLTPSQKMTQRDGGKKTPRTRSNKKRKSVVIIRPFRRLVNACTPAAQMKSPKGQSSKKKKNKTPKRGIVATSTPIQPGFVQVGV